MLAGYLHSFTGILEQKDHVEIFTTHVVTAPKKLDFIFNYDKRAIKKMKKSGIEIGNKFCCS